MNKNIKKLVLSGSLMIASALHADVVSYSNSVSYNPNGSGSLSLSRFDSSMGTLTGVHIMLSVTVDGLQVEMDNDTTTTRSLTLSYLTYINSLDSEVALLKDDSNYITSSDLELYAEQLFSLEATSGDSTTVFNATGASDYAKWTPGTINAIVESDIHSSVNEEYIGSSDFNISIDQLADVYSTLPSTFVRTLDNSSSLNAIFSGTVTYTYAIPEPAVISFILLFGGGMITIRRIKLHLQ